LQCINLKYKIMKKNTKKMIAILAMAVLTIGFISCSKDDDSSQPAPTNGITSVRLVFTDSIPVGIPKGKSGGDKVDLRKVSMVKIEYVSNDGSNTPQAVNQAELIMAGDSIKVSTLDRRILNFKGGSSVTIHSADLYDSEGGLLGTWTRAEPDTFEIAKSNGLSVMERTYGTAKLER
jgi:hypothetical protein